MIANQFRHNDLAGAWHLVYYVSRNQGPDFFSDQIIEFKNGNQAVIEKWINWTATEILKLLQN